LSIGLSATPDTQQDYTSAPAKCQPAAHNQPGKRYFLEKCKGNKSQKWFMPLAFFHEMTYNAAYKKAGLHMIASMVREHLNDQAKPQPRDYYSIIASHMQY